MRQIIVEPTRVTVYSSTLNNLSMVTYDSPIVGSRVLEAHDIAETSLVYCELDLESDHSHKIEESLKILLILIMNCFMLTCSMFYTLILNDDMESVEAKFNFVNKNLTYFLTCSYS